MILCLTWILIKFNHFSLDWISCLRTFSLSERDCRSKRLGQIGIRKTIQVILRVFVILNNSMWHGHSSLESFVGILKYLQTLDTILFYRLQDTTQYLCTSLHVTQILGIIVYANSMWENWEMKLFLNIQMTFSIFVSSFLPPINRLDTSGLFNIRCLFYQFPIHQNKAINSAWLNQFNFIYFSLDFSTSRLIS